MKNSRSHVDSYLLYWSVRHKCFQNFYQFNSKDDPFNFCSLGLVLACSFFCLPLLCLHFLFLFKKHSSSSMLPVPLLILMDENGTRKMEKRKIICPLLANFTTSNKFAKHRFIVCSHFYLKTYPTTISKWCHIFAALNRSSTHTWCISCVIHVVKQFLRFMWCSRWSCQLAE